MTCPICDSPMDHGRCAECGFIHHDLEPLTGSFKVLAPGHLVREYATLEDAIAGGRALCSSYGIFRIMRGSTLVKVVMVSPEDRRFALTIQHDNPVQKYRFAVPDRAAADRIVDRHQDMHWNGGIA